MGIYYLYYMKQFKLCCCIISCYDSDEENELEMASNIDKEFKNLPSNCSYNKYPKNKLDNILTEFNCDLTPPTSPNNRIDSKIINDNHIIISSNIIKNKKSDFKLLEESTQNINNKDTVSNIN